MSEPLCVDPGDLVIHEPSRTPYLVSLISPVSLALINLHSGGRWSQPATFYGRKPTGGTPLGNFPGCSKAEDWRVIPRDERAHLRLCDLT